MTADPVRRDGGSSPKSRALLGATQLLALLSRTSLCCTVLQAAKLAACIYRYGRVDNRLNLQFYTRHFIRCGNKLLTHLPSILFELF
jgi:hypothetical protein